MEREVSYRAISARAAIGYLENLGGEKQDDSTVVGDGWTAELDEDKVSIGPSVKLNEVTIVFEGTEAALEPLLEKFDQKAMRAGG
jgi:hypothetical protein